MKAARRLASFLACGVCTNLVACGGPEFGRIGQPVVLPNGAPRNVCESEEWYELAPARVRATGATAGIAYNTYYSQVFEGLAIFPTEGDDPEDLDDHWPAMREPTLEREHQARIEPVDAANRQTLYWLLGGVVVGGVGIGTAAAVEDDNSTVAFIAGITGVTGLLVGLIGALASQPSGADQVQADARGKLFIRGEDDPVRIQRAVNNLNGGRRRECGGRPTGFSAPRAQ